MGKITQYTAPALLSAKDIAAELQICQAAAYCFLRFTPGCVLVNNPRHAVNQLVKKGRVGPKQVKRMPRQVFIELQKRLKAEQLQKTLKTEAI